MLAVSTIQRSAIAPDLPTIAEAGLPGYDYPIAYGLVAPARLPKDVEAKLVAATVETLNDPALKARLLATGNEAAPMGSSDEYMKWASLNGKLSLERVIAAGVRAE